MTPPAHPPRLAQFVLRATLPSGPVRESVLGDVQERYRHQVAERGLFKAHWWYWMQALSIGSGYAFRRMAGNSDHKRVATNDVSEGSPRGGFLAGLSRDVAIAFRQVKKFPGFACLVIATVGLGIGANTLAVSAGFATFRPQLPFSDSDQLVRIYLVPDSRSVRLSPRAPVLQYLTEAVEGADMIAGSRFTNLTLQNPDGPERVIGNAISPGWLETIGVAPALGRGFTTGEQQAGEESGVVLIGHGTWRTRFGGADVLGTSIELDGSPRTIVGILPLGFSYPYGAEFWFPFRPDFGAQDAFWALNIKARLAPGTTVAQLTDELSAISVPARGQVGGFGEDMTLTPVPIREVLVDGQGNAIGWLLGAVVLLLVIVCTNLANLMFARASRREAEFAVRSSLGAPAWRLARQTLVESTLLTFAGGALGVALAWGGLGIMESLIPGPLQDLSGLRLGWAALLVSAVLTIGTGLAVGMAPVLRLAAVSPVSALKRGGRSVRGSARGDLSTLIVIGELAAALVLLAGVGVMVRALQEAQAVDLGYEEDDLLVFSLSLDREPFLEAAPRIYLKDELIDRLTLLPGVAGVGATTLFPLQGGNVIAQVATEAMSANEGDLVNVSDRMVSVGYLEQLGVRLVQGRYLGPGDGADSEPVAVIGERLAGRLWPGVSPIGQRLRNLREGDTGQWSTVVGVVEEVHEAGEIPYAWYRPYDQHAASRTAGVLSYFVRGSLGRTPEIRAVRDAIGAIAPTMPIFGVSTAAQINSDALARERNGARLGTILAVLGLGLAAMGVYGTVSGFVIRRRGEFAVRLALGGDWRAILSDISKRVGGMIVAGLVIGGIGGVLLVGVLGSRISELSTWSLEVFVGAGSILAVAAAASAAIPAVRAIRTQPMSVLSRE